MRGLAAASFLLVVTACAPKGPEGVDTVRLDDEIGRVIGDPSTCLLLAKKGSGEIVWRYGTHMTCARELPSCEGEGRTTLEGVKAAAAAGETRAISCPSLPDGSATVAWSAGPVAASAKNPDLVYAAVMEGERALPGREIAARLERAFERAGL